MAICMVFSEFDPWFNVRAARYLLEVRIPLSPNMVRIPPSSNMVHSSCPQSIAYFTHLRTKQLLYTEWDKKVFPLV